MFPVRYTQAELKPGEARVQLLGGGFAVVSKYPLAALVGSGCFCKRSQALSFGLFLGARFSFDVKQDVYVN